MLRRFSINFALFSMLLDGLSVMLCLWFSAAIRPAMNDLSFIKTVLKPAVIPSSLYILFPLIWIVIFSSLSIYDGRKFLRSQRQVSCIFPIVKFHGHYSSYL
jgi:hypothetical protein